MVDENRPVEILLVEDNPGDERLTREALKEGKVYSNLHWVKDGVEAMQFLRREGKYSAVPRPDIILLDLNLPKKDGREVLHDIKNDGDLKRTLIASGIVMSPRTSPSSRMRFASTHALIVLVVAAGRMMNSAPSPSEYISPGPPMNANPESVADIVASVSGRRPIPPPATKKSFAVRVLRVAQAPMSATTTKYATATPMITGCVSGGSGAV